MLFKLVYDLVAARGNSVNREEQIVCLELFRQMHRSDMDGNGCEKKLETLGGDLYPKENIAQKLACHNIF